VPALRAIENGANFLAEGFLFSVAAALIIGETWRSSRSQSKKRSDVNDSIEGLQTRVRELSARLQRREEVSLEEQQRYVCSMFSGTEMVVLIVRQKSGTLSHFRPCRRNWVARWLGRVARYPSSDPSH
jgi:Optic atrophy 3 protein (OPA3)